MPRAYTSDGNISPCRFVSPSNNFRVQQSVLGDLPLGISSDAQMAAPITGSGYTTSTLAAASGDQLSVFADGEDCLLEAGSGGWNAGDLLKADGNGKGIVANSTANDPIGARAIDGASAGEKARVRVQIHVGS